MIVVMARLVSRRLVPATRAPRGSRGLAVALAMGAFGALVGVAIHVGGMPR